jgi:hypothetical protein
MARAFDAKTTAGVHWSKSENDWMCTGPTRATQTLLAHRLVGTDTFQQILKELEGRGYDLSTLRFSVKKKKDEK